MEAPDNMAKEIAWGSMPRTPHGELGCITTRWGTLRIAAVINEALNPNRPVGAVSRHPKPFTLELYIPLPVGTDKVQKYATADEAKAKAATALARFIHEVAS